MFKNNFLLIIFIFFTYNIYAKSIDLKGISRLSVEDIQSITSININDNNLNINDINIFIKELSLSDLIYEIEYVELSDQFSISITESDLIENIYINNNVWIKDDFIIENLNSKQNYFLQKNNIQNDIQLIKDIYKTKGFQNVQVTAKVEKYSSDRVNLIYDIKETKQQKIHIIKFFGNNFFSNNYLNSIIESQSLKFYNIFKSGSNINYSLFNFDKNKIISKYKDEGFADVKVSYSIEKTSFNSNVLFFYIEEGKRKKIDKIDIDFSNQYKNLSIDSTLNDFDLKLKENNNYYSKELIDEYVELLNINLLENNIYNLTIKANVYEINNNLAIKFFDENIEPVLINLIDIRGNTITKNKTIRSKISIEPGQYLNQYSLEKSIKNLESYPYIKKVNLGTNINDQLADLTFNIEEDNKTGNILLAGTFNDDTGAGLTFGIEDKNIFGSGNSISSNFSINSEDLKFDINYTQYPIINPYLTNTYTLFNQDNDYTNSFGFKASRKGLGYSINFKQNEQISYGLGIRYEEFKGHSGVNATSNAINDNIGNFENYKLRFSYKSDSSNDFFNPTNGTINKIDITISPENISDDSYYKIFLTNKNYRQLAKSQNYLFLNNYYGYAKPLNGKLKTMNAFGLGGLNFKGFDYKGIGPYDGNIYLGGNEYFTSTIGYGSSFIFDDKDNINIKFFMTTGSIWDSDYSSSSDVKLRTSLGTSFDFITPIGPLSFSYATPVQKNSSDKTRPFNFSIGTSF